MLIAEGRMPVSPEANTRYLTALAQKEISQVQVGTQPWRDITPDQALPNAVPVSYTHLPIDTPSTNTSAISYPSFAAITKC